MADLLWGKVYYKDQYAGTLREEPGERFVFTYEKTYLDSSAPAIAVTLPKKAAPIISELGLPSFFDNLVAEGWMEGAQARALGKRNWKRFELLLAFGADCAGAVSIVDPEPEAFKKFDIDKTDPKDFAVLQSRASLSGVQPKLAVIKDGRVYRSAKRGEVSTHIAKFASPHLPDIIEIEFLSTIATHALLPNEDVVEMEIRALEKVSEPALIIKRFDRASGGKLHFEEFTQLLDMKAESKYKGAYSDMAEFMRGRGDCLPADIYRLLRRILVGIILGNTDMHLKNFAMWHAQEGLRLTPIYDQVAAALYHPKYQELALKIPGVADISIGSLKDKHMRHLAKEFGIDDKQLEQMVAEIEARLEPAKTAIENVKDVHDGLKEQLIKLIGKRWNGTFRLIGRRS